MFENSILVIFSLLYVTGLATSAGMLAYKLVNYTTRGKRHETEASVIEIHSALVAAMVTGAHVYTLIAFIFKPEQVGSSMMHGLMAFAALLYFEYFVKPTVLYELNEAKKRPTANDHPATYRDAEEKIGDKK